MYKSTGSNFTNPSDGEHDAVVIGWEDRGISQNTYDGKTREVHQAVIKYEILDETLPDEASFGDNASMRLVLWDWVNIAFGKQAKLTERRIGILGLNPDDRDARNVFDENDLLGVRVIIYVKVNENGNAKVLDVRRHEDQNYGELENDLKVTPCDEDPPSEPQTPAQPAKPTPPRLHPPLLRADARSTEERLNDAKEYFILLVGTCIEKELMDNAGEWAEWAENPDLALDDLKQNIKVFEGNIKQAGYELPKVEVHPLSSGGDGIPF